MRILHASTTVHNLLLGCCYATLLLMDHCEQADWSARRPRTTLTACFRARMARGQRGNAVAS